MESVNNNQGKGRRPVEEDLEDDFDQDDDMELEDIDITQQVDHRKQIQAQGGIVEEDEEIGDAPLQVDFLFLDPSQSQFFSVKSLLNGLLDGLSFRSSDLANIVCDQVVVGTMIGVDGDDDKPNEKSVIAFTTLLPLKAYENQDVMKEIIGYIVSKSETHNENHQAFFSVLKDQTDKVGLLINERMINLSPQLVPTLHGQLCEDVNWIQNEKTEDSALFNLKYILVLSKCYKEPKAPKKKVKSDYESLIYQKFEDFVFLQKALFRFTFTAKSSKNVAGLTNLETVAEDQICERLIYLLKIEDYVSCVQSLPSYLEG